MSFLFEPLVRSKIPSMPALSYRKCSLLDQVPRSKSEPLTSNRGTAAGVAIELATGVFYSPPGPSSGSSSLRVVTFNTMCTALGTGILAIPHVLTDVGLLGGVTLLLILWVLTERSAACISLAADLTGEALYTEIVTSAFGPTVGFATGIILVLYCFSSCVGALVVLKQAAFRTCCTTLRLSTLYSATSVCGLILSHPSSPPPPHPQLLPHVIRFLSNASLALPSTECIVVIAIFLVPLSALPSMERLKFTSFASVTLQGVIVACVALAAVSSNIQARSPNTHLIVNPVQPIPMISYDPLAWM
ncbi:MAG: hypothetical protein SGPRY_011169, partial [Prymnesium sp.]